MRMVSRVIGAATMALPVVLVALGVVAQGGMAKAEGLGVQPGRWETSVTVTSAQMPDGLAAVAKMMVGRTTKTTQCVTPEQAAQGPREMMKTHKTCSFTRYSMAGGKISSEMVCVQGGSTITSTSTGGFTATSFNTTGRSVLTGRMPMTVTATAVGKRIGDCAG